MSEEFGPLQEATMADLMGEIRRRFDDFVFAGVSRIDGGSLGAYFDYRGSHFTMVGLTEHLGEKVRAELREIEEDIDGQ